MSGRIPTRPSDDLQSDSAYECPDLVPRGSSTVHHCHRVPCTPDYPVGITDSNIGRYTNQVSPEPPRIYDSGVALSYMSRTDDPLCRGQSFNSTVYSNPNLLTNPPSLDSDLSRNFTQLTVCNPPVVILDNVLNRTSIQDSGIYRSTDTESLYNSQERQNSVGYHSGAVDSDLGYPSETVSTDEGYPSGAVNSGVGLLGGNIDPYGQNLDGDTYLNLLIIHEKKPMVENILRHCTLSADLLNIQNRLLQTALMLAVLTNQPAVVRLLIAWGASLEVRDRFGNTALHIAAQRGYFSCVLELTRPLKPPEVTHCRYPIPFHVIPQDQSIMNYEGWTCLHLAVQNNHHKIVDHLIKFCHANPSCQDGRGGETPLHICVARKNLRLMQLLLDNTQLDLNVCRYDGCSPLALAQGLGHANEAKLLEQCGAVAIWPNSDDEAESDTDSKEQDCQSIRTIHQMDYDDFVIDGSRLA